MIKKVHISASNQATFVCPECFNTKTVDVKKYKTMNIRTKVKSTCSCGFIWTSILERRTRFRVAVNIPCNCTYMGASGSSETNQMRIADLSTSGMKITLDKNKSINTDTFSFDDPILVDFNLENQDRTHIKIMTHVKHISKSYLGAEFNNSVHDISKSIGSYIFRPR